MARAEPGELIPGQGIFLGQYQPKDRTGNSLGKIFNVFAAPQDLPDTMKYADLVKHIARLEAWHGFDGANYATDKEIYAALKDGSYNGGWIIPPRELLTGTEADSARGLRVGKVVQPDNLLRHKNKGAFKNTFKISTGSFGSPVWYWSSTEVANSPSKVWCAGFSNGQQDWTAKDNLLMHCRPVRLVEAPLPRPA